MYKLLHTVKISILGLLLAATANLLGAKDQERGYFILGASAEDPALVSPEEEEDDDGEYDGEYGDDGGDDENSITELENSSAPTATTADVSPDGRWVVVGYYNGYVVLYTGNGSKLGPLDFRLNEPVRLVKFSPDGKMIAVATQPPIRIRRRDVNALPGQDQTALVIKNERYNPSASYNLVVFRLNEKNNRFEVYFTFIQPNDSYFVQSFDFTPDSSTLVVGYRNPDHVRFIDLKNSHQGELKAILYRGLQNSGGVGFVKALWSCDTNTHDLLIICDEEVLLLHAGVGSEHRCMIRLHPEWFYKRFTSLMACGGGSKTIFLISPTMLERLILPDKVGDKPMKEEVLSFAADEDCVLSSLVSNEQQDRIAVFVQQGGEENGEMRIDFLINVNEQGVFDESSTYTYPYNIKFKSARTGQMIGARFLTSKDFVFFARYVSDDGVQWGPLLLYRIHNYS